MRCPECRTKVTGDLQLCPNCGTMIEETRPMRASRSKPPDPASTARPATPQRTISSRWRLIRTTSLWVLILVLLLALSAIAAVYWGVRQGERQKVEQRLQAAEEHYRVGLQRLDEGEHYLAIAEFEYVLELNPEHAYAQQGIDEAEARVKRLAVLPTPTSETYELVADDLYQAALVEYEAGRWEDAVAELTQLRVFDPTHRREEVEDMLFTSLYNAGLASLEEDRFEEGIFYLDQAVALRPLDEEALAQRSLAIQYMTALGYWGVDWEVCIARFGQLVATAPNYKDVFQRLYRAHVTYGNAWYDQGEMCPAEEQYTLALQLLTDPTVEEKRAEAVEICLVATPTPVGPITGTQPIMLEAPPPGFNTGQLAYPIYNGQTGVYDIYVLSQGGRLVRMAAGGDQPWWWGGSGTLMFRDRIAGSVALLEAGAGTPYQLASGAGVAWPSFSPDGTRITYAAQDEAGKWHIYLGLSDGSVEATSHADGKGPIWGPTGLLAWTGCEISGACGIFVDNPDDDQPAQRLTASSNDIGLNWAPNGELLAYMSNVTGNWDVYLLSISGGVARLTDDPAADGLPAWAPDGSGLAFVSNRDETWGVYLMGPNGQDPHKILSLGPNLPDWTLQRLSWGP